MSTEGLGSGLPPKPSKGEEEEVEEVVNDPDFALDAETAQQLMAAAGGSKGLINALKARLDGMVGQKSGFIETLPAPVQNRIAFLEKLQEEHDELEDKYREERDALDAKYRTLYEPLYVRREKIVVGSEEAPPPEEGAPPAAAEEKDVPKGIPEFWLNVLRNHPAIGELVTEKDEPVLAYLTNVTSETLEKQDDKGFRLTFTFGPNPFFTNEKLTKTYVMVDEDEPILERAEGTEINWNTGKNPTVKVLKKKPKKGGRGGKGGQAQTKIEPCESFFNFFSPPAVPDEEEELEEEEMEELQQALEEDYDIGETIKDRLIPHAVSWYTGDAIDQGEGDMYAEDDDDDEEEGEDDEDEDEDDDDDGEGDQEGLKDTKEQPPECKQQ